MEMKREMEIRRILQDRREEWRIRAAVKALAFYRPEERLDVFEAALRASDYNIADREFLNSLGVK